MKEGQVLRGFSLKRPIKAISRKVVFFLRLLLLELTLSGVVADNPFPDWFTFNGTHRSRVEVLDGQFRPSLDGGDQLVAFRTTLALRVERETFDAEFELMDSRQSLSDRGTPLGTDDVNSLALLQASIGVGLQDYLGADAVSFRLGRQTMDLGGRRLIARNRFRNTVNSFTGLSAQWYRGKDLRLNSFYFLPVSRRPSGFNRLIDHDIQIDQESFSRRLWGLHGERSGLWFDSVGEAYLVRLDESDTIREPSKNRKLFSPGLRWLRRSKVGQFDFDIEGVGQFGQSRATRSAVDPLDLDHRAWMTHVEFGYTSSYNFHPRLSLIYDIASGDRNPIDAEQNRFDTLYGARRFEYGPTGILGAFARSNISSPGYKLLLQPRENWNVMMAHRFFRLASEKDAWTTTGMRDISGLSGSDLGNQLETRVRWQALPQRLLVELGFARIWGGGFIEANMPAGRQINTNYGYVQLGLTF